MQIHYFTKLACHFVDVGSVVAVSLPQKETTALMRCLDDVNILEKIGYHKKLEADRLIESVLLFI